MEPEPPADPVDSGTAPRPPLHEECQVVGVGASAGGLEAFTRLLRSIPPDTGHSFVLVQHLDASHRSSLSEILGRVTAMPVAEAVDGAPAQANHVAVIPPNTELTISGRTLRLTPRVSLGPHLPIDQFLKSLARDCGSRGVGVILSGTGSDGAAGLQAVRDAGGVTFVQDPSTTEFPGMPTMASALGPVDFVLAPEQIAAQLVEIARHPHFAARGAPEAAREPGALDDAQLAAICELMRKATGIDFGLYRETTVARRVSRRLALRNVSTVEEYARLLASEPAERAALQADLLVGVTSFFREPDSFEALKELVFPAIVADRPAGTTLRIWVPGCASGAEPYSILIALQEFQTERGLAFPVHLLASDINDRAIAKARAGLYPDSIVSDVSPERLRQHFTRVESGYQIAASLRERCIFSRHNLLEDPPFSKLDLVSCRNVLIYLDAVQRRIIPLFHYALLDHGFLMLGRAETTRFADLVTPVEPRLRIYAKRAVARKPYGLLARPDTRRPASQYRVGATAEVTLRDGADLSREADRLLLSQFTPTGVLVDENLDVIETRGRTAPFLTLPTGKVSFSLWKLVPDTGLFLEVERLVREAAATGQPAKVRRTQSGAAGRTGEMIVSVTPLHARQRKAYLVLFETGNEVGGGDGARDGSLTVSDPDAGQIATLKRDLEEARQRLVALVEEHETAEQESQEVTEDALSANEELQSLTEELETAKEELQSTNEELLTVNRDLESRNIALTSALDFTRAIVETVRIPLVVVDGDLIIRHANASFARAFPELPDPADGQPLLSIGEGAWNVPGLRERLERVLPAGHTFDGFEVTVPLPATGDRTLVLSGYRLEPVHLILLTIEDVSAQRVSEQALRQSEDRRRQSEKLEVVGRLAGGIAHDFNNLLTVVLGYCELLGATLGADPESGFQVSEIRKAAERAAELTDQLLAFSRRKVLRPRVFDLNAVVVEFERMLQRLLGESVRVVVRCAPDLWPALADPVEVSRAVMNLAINARDAMPAGGTLTIETSNRALAGAQAAQHDLPEGHYVALLVRDTGIGMDETLRAHLFEPFFSSKDASKGAGLGLSTALGIIRQSGGAITCDSAVGRGTQFTILLPAETALPAEPAPPAGLSQAPRGSGEVVLLVDDEDGVRRLARRILEASGYAVLDASGAHDALTLLDRHTGRVDVLVTDVVMPDVGGRQFAERVRALRPAVKVLFVSGHTADDVILKQGLGEGTAFLAKPFSPGELAWAVRRVLDA